MVYSWRANKKGSDCVALLVSMNNKKKNRNHPDRKKEKTGATDGQTKNGRCNK